MKRKLTMFLSLFFLGIGILTAQTQVQVKGIVVDEAGEPVIGATIQIKGGTQGTISGADGDFTLSAPEGGTLIVSFIGMKTVEVAVSTNIRVVLEEGTQLLEEVTITAYGGAVTREAKTGAVGSVKGDAISDAPVVSMDKALGGKIAGVSITSSSGQPGATSSIRIRGTSSINAGNNPLWVVDGVPVMTGDASTYLNTSNALSSISPNDIESITVLKDAAAASIYGSRAANGVILVTTKSGKDGKTSFSARARFGTSWLANDNNFGVMNASQLLAYQRDAIVNAGMNPDDPTGTYYRPKELLSRPLTNWMDHLTRMGAMQEYEINATGSNAKAKYYNSLTYNKTDGVFYGVNMHKITGRVNAEYKLTEKLEMGTRLNLAYTEGNDVPMQSLYYANPIFAGMTILPWTPAYNAQGKHNVNIPENSGTNPRATAEYDDQYGKAYQLLGNIFLQYKPIKQVTLKTTNAIESINGDGRRYWSQETNGGKTNLQTAVTQYVRLTTSNTATYNDLLLDDHSLRVLVGQEAMKNTFSSLVVQAPEVNPDIPYVQTAPQTGVQGSQGISAETLLSYFGMLDYNYLEKYYLQASLRFDGSSLFGADNRWGTFYSIGTSWNIYKEDFMSDLSFLNLLKLRLSYGLNGNNNIAAYRAYGVYSVSQYNGGTGLLPSRPSNPNLSWEKNGTWNIGLDFTLFEKLDGNIDIYNRKTTDMLLDKNVPQTTGFSTNFLNIGSLQNRGVEIQLNYDIINTNEWKWEIGGNIAFNKTKILNLGDNEEIAYSEDSRLRHMVGKSLYTFRLRDYYGVDPTTGNALWVDGDGSLTTDYTKSRYVYPASPEPKFLGGFNTSVSWNGFNLGAFFEFKGGNYVMLIERRYMESDGNQMSLNQLKTGLNYWKKPGDTGVNPKPIAGNSTESNNFGSTRFLQRGDYLRVKDVTLSYTFPKKVMDKAKIGGLKLYMSAQNIYTFHDVDWWDPERGVDGIGYGIYPMTKAMVGGLELSF